MKADLEGTTAPQAVVCEVIARAWLRVPLGDIPALRKVPGPGATTKIAPTFLKQSDAQTVAGLTAVFQAIDTFGLHGRSFDDWGVLGVPCAFGRVTVSLALQKFLEEGAWAISPHLIPHSSLHSLSGTISHALKIHGPNLGIGGGPHGIGEGLLVAAAMLAQGIPGVWLIMTRLVPDAPPDKTGALEPGTQIAVLALALTLASDNQDSRQLRIQGDATSNKSGLDLLKLADLLERGEAGSLPFSGGRVDWQSKSPLSLPSLKALESPS